MSCCDLCFFNGLNLVDHLEALGLKCVCLSHCDRDALNVANHWYYQQIKRWISSKVCGPVWSVLANASEAQEARDLLLLLLSIMCLLEKFCSTQHSAMRAGSRRILTHTPYLLTLLLLDLVEQSLDVSLSQPFQFFDAKLAAKSGDTLR